MVLCYTYIRNNFPDNTAVISFYTPVNNSDRYKVDYQNVCDSETAPEVYSHAYTEFDDKLMHKSLEPDKEPDITRGTLEGDIAASEITLFRLQSTADAQLRAYIAEGEMARFYRYELIEHNFPHHGAVAFAHVGNILHKVFRYLGVTEIGHNRSPNEKYPTEIRFN